MLRYFIFYNFDLFEVFYEISPTRKLSIVWLQQLRRLLGILWKGFRGGRDTFYGAVTTELSPSLSSYWTNFTKKNKITMNNPKNILLDVFLQFVIWLDRNGNCWKYTDNDSTFLKIGWNYWIYLEMAENGKKWLKMAENNWKWLDVALNYKTWLQIV